MLHTHIPLSYKGLFTYNMGRKVRPSLALAWEGSRSYQFLAEHIRAVFQKTYGADITVNYPLLLGVVDSEDETPLAVLGIRRAAENTPLFLERYLTAPAEVCIEKITGHPLPRKGVAEAGNLASLEKGNLLILLYGLACYLEREGVDTIFFTGTEQLTQRIHSMGLYPHVLAEATPEKLGEDKNRWGSYYDTHPKVMAGSVLAFREGLERYFQSLKG